MGGIAAAGVVSALFPGALNVGTRLGGGTSISQGLFIEMFLTAQLVFVIIMLAAVKHKSTFLAPVGIGLAFFVTEMIGMFVSSCLCMDHSDGPGIYYTGGSLNPARSLGPDVINRQFPGYHWIYWVGPLLGSLLASGFFALLQRLRYETCNPGQDYNELEAKLQSEALNRERSDQEAKAHRRELSDDTVIPERDAPQGTQDSPQLRSVV